MAAHIFAISICQPVMSILSIVLYVFLACLSIQVIYWLSFLRLIFYNSKSDDKSPEAISIIVCAWNEEENLKELVPLLLQQDHPNYELIVVDDRSVDSTYEYLFNLQADSNKVKLVRIDEVPDHMNSKKYALLLGIKAAKNDLLLLTDADCRPKSPDWAKNMAKEYDSETQFVIGYSPYYFKWSLLNLLIQFETLLTGIHYLSATLWGAPYMAVGRNLSYRKSFFLTQNGFSGIQHIVGGDDDLFVNKYANGKNSKICISPHSIVDSVPKSNWKSYIMQKKRHFSVGRSYKLFDKIRLTLFSTSQIIFWICFVTLSLLSANPYVTFGGFGLRLVLQIIVLGLGAKKLSGKFPLIVLPVIDLIFAVLLPLLSVPALLSKKIKWS